MISEIDRERARSFTERLYYPEGAEPSEDLRAEAERFLEEILKQLEAGGDASRNLGLRLGVSEAELPPALSEALAEDIPGEGGPDLEELIEGLRKQCSEILGWDISPELANEAFSRDDELLSAAFERGSSDPRVQSRSIAVLMETALIQLRH